MEKFVYLFNELDEAETRVDGNWEEVRSLLGGKGANLGDMTRLGIPVPPGFTVTSRACMAYLEGDAWPEGLWEQEMEAIRGLESLTDRAFGDPDKPLLVSCRSGARFSMPGMMDTVLNVGMNDEIAEAMVARTGDGRFVYDLYRRLVHMFGSVVMDVPDEVFEAVIAARRRSAGVASDTEFDDEDWRAVTGRFQQIYRSYTHEPFPQDPEEQLRRTTEAVFRSWMGRRAVDYRKAAGIDGSLGTAVTIQRMVYGNIGEGSATGVAMSRNATTGVNQMEGDFLVNAQGEDVVAGIRTTRPLGELAQIMPEVARQLQDIAADLEAHYRNMQDMEFTVDRGHLWILQTRDGKRTPQAEVRIAVDQVREGLISREEAVSRVKPDQIDAFLHPRLDPEAVAGAVPVASGLNVSPGAAVGMAVLDPDSAERWAEAGRPVIMVRPETKPDDVHGMLAAEGILTTRGGRTSHAALVARQFGKPAVVGATDLDIDLDHRTITTPDGTVIKEGEWIALDGTHGLVYQGKLATVDADLSNPELLTLLEWADSIRKIEVRANADYPADAQRAREYGAQGIGLCRTEHMFFEADRLSVVQSMIMAETGAEREEALATLLPLQRDDFEGLFRAMEGLPVVIRLLDPPLHEFLPTAHDLASELADLKLSLRDAGTLGGIDDLLTRIQEKQRLLDRVEELSEANPMLGTRGVRLSILIPQLPRMQVRAVFEAAARCIEEGVDARPEIMIPLVSHVQELREQQAVVDAVAHAVQDETGVNVPYLFGSMIEVPRAALTAGQMAESAQFFSFGTNDLTQTTFGISRDDAESGFLVEYLRRHILPANPFATIDRDGVGRLISIATEDGRAVRPELEVGICGEHGGDPETIQFCHEVGLDYVSCSPFRVPVARLAAAHAALADADAALPAAAPEELETAQPGG